MPAMLAALAEHAPLTAAELAVQIAEDEDAVAKELSYRGDVLETEGGWYSIASLADEAVLTHVVTAKELALGVPRADGDLDLWGRLADTGALRSRAAVRCKEPHMDRDVARSHQGRRAHEVLPGLLGLRQPPSAAFRWGAGEARP